MVYISRVAIGADTWEITAGDRGVREICRCCSFVRAPENEHTRKAAEELQEYFAGTRKTFDLALDLAGTPFQRQVWAQLRTIPFGSAVCYSQVAQAIGRPEAVRAVAQAIGRNPCLIVVPCHRVLGKDGSLTGFSAGLDLKKQLLNLEGIPYK